MSVKNKIIFNFGATALQSIIGFGTIPVFTYYLGASDFGIFALSMLGLNLVLSFAETGAGFVLYGNFHRLNFEERGEMISSLLMYILFVGCVVLLLAFVTLWIVEALDLYVAPFTGSMYGSLVVIFLCRNLLSVLSLVFISEERSVLWGGVLVGQACVVLLSGWVSLEYLSLGGDTLFISAALGAVFSLTTTVVILRRYLAIKMVSEWSNKVAKLHIRAFLTSISENGKSFFEGAYITQFVGVSGFGEWSHARLYQGALTQASNAFGNALWSKFLDVGREQSANFHPLMRYWNVAYVFLALVGIFFANFGVQLVEFVTHGTFSLAGTWLSWLVVYVLLQNAGKPATAILYARELGNVYSSVRLISIVVSISSLIVLVPYFGVFGALASLLLEMILTRVGLVFAAFKHSGEWYSEWVLYICITSVVITSL